MSLLNRVLRKEAPGEEPKNSQGLAFMPLAGGALAEENWLREELA
jgi:hypothetical protein